MNLDDLHHDFEHHIEEETRDNIERGMSPAEARAAALRKFGNTARAVEDTYAVWHRLWLDRLGQDLRYAWRGLRKNPGFAAVAILTLALGIGMNTAVFSVVNAVLLRPLPYPEADRLVWVADQNERFGFNGLAGADFYDFRRAQSFEAMADYTYGAFPLIIGDQSRQTGVASVGDGFFAITGARPILGRLFTQADQNAMLLTHKLWTRDFGADPKAVGRAVTFNGHPFVVCGVLPESYRFTLPREGVLDLRGIEAYTPTEMTPASQVRGRNQAIVNAVAKLKPGVTVSQAYAELAAMRARTAQDDPAGFYSRLKLGVMPMQEKLVGGSRRALLVLLAAVGFVLLIACGNIANLLLARASSRQREMAVRAAIGAGRGRAITQLLVEGGVLALAGGAAGLLLARIGLAAVVRLGANAVPRLTETSLDWRVLGFTLLASLLTGLVFGLGPALSLSRVDLASVLKAGGRLSSASAGALAARRLLLAGEFAIALVLLTGAGLMLRSVWLMRAYPAGFEPERIVTMKVSLAGAAYKQRPEQEAYFGRALESVSQLPGVSSAAVSMPAMSTFVNAEGVQFPPNQAPRTLYPAVSAGYFQTMGMRLVAGRWLTDDEPAPVVVVNETFARAVYGGADPVGRRLQIPSGNPGRNLRATIVGVVGDLKSSKLDAEVGLETYVPYRQAPFIRMMTVMVRASGDPGAVTSAAQRAVSEIDRTQPVYDVKTLEEALSDGIAPRRFNLLLLAVFASVALALAAVGIYGVMSYTVTQRAQEIGVRMALGAQRREVVRMVVRQGMLVAVVGMAAGVGAALGLTRLMSGLLYGIQPTDPATFAAVTAVLALAALGACLAPALRASRVDPVVALRYE